MSKVQGKAIPVAKKTNKKNQSECITSPDGSKEWYLNGKRHRENGPAYERPNGSKSWFLNGERHREDGPAIEQPDGSKFWYLNDKLHREDGPATEWADGTKEWYLNGKKITFGFKSKGLKVNALQEIMKIQEVLET